MGYKEALKKHLGDLGYSKEQIAAILDGIQEPEEPKGLSPEDKLENYQKLSEDYEKLQADYNSLDESSKASQKRMHDLLIESQVRTKLGAARVKDMDYAMFKLKQAGELTRGEDEKVVDLDKRIEALKKSIPDNFSPAQESTKSVVERKPASFDQSGSAFEPHNLNEALQDVYSNEN